MPQQPILTNEALWLLRLLGAATTLALIAVGKPLLVPLVLAFLLWAVINALADQLNKFGVPSFLSRLGSIVVIAGGVFLVIEIIAGESGNLASDVPAIGARLENVLSAWMSRLHLHVDIGDVVNRPEFAQVLSGVAGSIGGSFVGIIQVLVFVVFLLAEQQNLPAKFARLFAQEGRREQGQEVFHAVMRQVQRFLGVTTLTSTLLGGTCYLVMRILGVPFPGLFAIILFVLSYIPIVGMGAIALPPLMALAQFGTLTAPLILLGVLGGVRLVLKEVVETILLGRTLNLSPFAIVLALTFWELVWGPAGLFLAVPLTAAIVIVSDHIAPLQWISTVLGAPRPPRARSADR